MSLPFPLSPFRANELIIKRDATLRQLPFNLLVALGSYCLWELGWGVLTFGECNEAHAELMKVRYFATNWRRTRALKAGRLFPLLDCADFDFVRAGN